MKHKKLTFLLTMFPNDKEVNKCSILQYPFHYTKLNHTVPSKSDLKHT
jgi:hypothetical protein